MQSSNMLFIVSLLWFIGALFVTSTTSTIFIGISSLFIIGSLIVRELEKIYEIITISAHKYLKEEIEHVKQMEENQSKNT